MGQAGSVWCWGEELLKFREVRVSFDSPAKVRWEGGVENGFPLTPLPNPDKVVGSELAQLGKAGGIIMWRQSQSLCLGGQRRGQQAHSLIRWQWLQPDSEPTASNETGSECEGPINVNIVTVQARVSKNQRDLQKRDETELDKLLMILRVSSVTQIRKGSFLSLVPFNCHLPLSTQVCLLLIYTFTCLKFINVIYIFCTAALWQYPFQQNWLDLYWRRCRGSVQWVNQASRLSSMALMSFGLRHTSRMILAKRASLSRNAPQCQSSRGLAGTGTDDLHIRWPAAAWRFRGRRVFWFNGVPTGEPPYWAKEDRW